MTIVFYVFVALIGISEVSAQHTFPCTLTGVWNNGEHDEELHKKGISNRMVTCYRVKGGSQDRGSVAGFLDKNNTEIWSVEYRFLTQKGTWYKKTFLKQDIERIAREHNMGDIDIEDLMLSHDFNSNQDVVKKLLAASGYEDASSIYIDSKGIVLTSNSDFWVRNGSNFEKRALERPGQGLLTVLAESRTTPSEQCEYTGRPAIWKCNLPACIQIVKIFDKVNRDPLLICRANMACHKEGGPLVPSVHSCKADPTFGCPMSAYRCKNDQSLSDLNLGTSPADSPDSREIADPKEGSAI